MSAVDKRDRMVAAGDAMNYARRICADDALVSAHWPTALLNSPDDASVIERARAANEAFVAARSAWLAALDIYLAIGKESE